MVHFGRQQEYDYFGRLAGEAIARRRMCGSGHKPALHRLSSQMREMARVNEPGAYRSETS